jgi:hypothetical protein
MNPNKTSEAARKMLQYIRDNDVVTWHSLADKHLYEVLKKFILMEFALEGLFGAMKNEMTVRGLPLEWIHDSPMGKAEQALKSDYLAGEQSPLH